MNMLQLMDVLGVLACTPMYRHALIGFISKTCTQCFYWIYIKHA